MEPAGSAVERTSSGTWAEFSVWAALGAAAAFGLVIFGVLAVIPIAVGVWLTLARPALRRSWFGVLTGVGAMSLSIAYVQRRGPGTFCWQTVNGSGCDRFANPWPWLAVGSALVVAGAVAQVRHVRRGPDTSDAGDPPRLVG